MKKEIVNGLILSVVILLVALSRLMPHPMNFTPIVAISMFSAAYFKDSLRKFGIPFSIIVFSDLLIHLTKGSGFHSSTLIVYLSFVLIIFSSDIFLKKITIRNLFIASVTGSILFFLITNFALFYPQVLVSNPSLGQYSHDFSGITASYIAGLPFFKNMLVGDLFYSALMFGAVYLLEKAKLISFKVV